MKICSVCGASVDDNSKFCPQCGVELDNNKSETIVTDDGRTIDTSKVTDSEIHRTQGGNEYKPLVCKQCQALLHPTDEEWERGEVKCDHCGAVTPITERIKHDIEGTVKVDNSEQAKGYLNLADRAWSAKNYDEALTYYTKELELVPDDIVAIYRKGICSIQAKKSVSEFKVYYEDACKILKEKLNQFNSIPDEELTEEQRNSKDRYTKISEQMSREILDYLTYMLGVSGLSDASYVVCETPYQCEDKLEDWEIIANVYYIVSLYIIDPEAKEKVLHDGALLISKMEKMPLLYKQQIINSNGHPYTKEMRYQVSSRFQCSMADMHKIMVEMYNDLPTRKSKEDRLNGELGELKETNKKLTEERDKTKKKLNSAINNLWSNNAEVKSRRNFHALLPLGVLLVGIIFGVISYFTNILLYGIIVFVVAIIVAIILWGPVYSNFKKNVFSDEIKELQKSLAEIEENCAKNEKALNSKQNEINNFEKEKDLTF